MKRHFLLAPAALLFSMAAAAQVQPSADSILASNRVAMGASPAQGTVEAHYSLSGQGLTGTAVRINDLATGAFILRRSLPPMGDTVGFDGKTPWMRDFSGAVTAQEGGDRVTLATNWAWRNAGCWWRANYCGASIRYAGRETLDGEAADHLVVTPKGGHAFDAWFDADTHFLTRIAEDQMFFHTRTMFADYAMHAGVMVPESVTFDPGAGKANYLSMHLTDFRIDEPRPITSYARPTDAPTGAVIEGGHTSVTLPFRLLNNHIYVKARVNGHGPYTFIVDTGGHTIMSPRIVREAGLESVGASAASGAGEKISTNGYAKVHEIALGDLKMRDQTAITMNIYDAKIEGIPVDGMVGAELFSRFAVTIDYGHKTLTFTRFDAFDPRGKGVALPFKFYTHLPQVAGKVDGIPMIFDIDTGSRSEIDITSPTVAKYDMRAKYPRGVTTITGWGVGGPVKSHVVRLPSLSMGPVKVVDVVAALSGAKGGSISDANFGGNIGSGLLKRFVTSFDYSKQIMYLRRILPPPADAGQFDRSGLWINAEDGGYKATYVAEGSPAAEAGIVVGDVITAIDGKPAESAGLSDARVHLRALPAGTRVPVTVRHGDETRNCVIVLRDQI